MDPEVATVETEPVETDAAAKAEEAEDREFSAGFEDVETKPTEEPPPAEPAPEELPVVQAEVVPEPTYAKITEEELTGFRATATKIDEIKAAADKAMKAGDLSYGRYGEIQRLVEEMKSSALNGEAVKVLEEDFKEMKADFPELATMLGAGFDRVLSRLKGPVPVASAPAFDPVKIQQAVSAQYQAEREASKKEDARERMAELVPDWEKIIGPEHSNTEFRQWLAKQDAAYQKEISEVWSASVITKSIKKFQGQIPKPPAPPKPPVPSKPSLSRTERFEGALQPRGAGGNPPAHTKTEDDEFKAGFTE